MKPALPELKLKNIKREDTSAGNDVLSFCLYRGYPKRSMSFFGGAYWGSQKRNISFLGVLKDSFTYPEGKFG